MMTEDSGFFSSAIMAPFAVDALDGLLLATRRFSPGPWPYCTIPNLDRGVVRQGLGLGNLRDRPILAS